MIRVQTQQLPKRFLNDVCQAEDSGKVIYLVTTDRHEIR